MYELTDFDITWRMMENRRVYCTWWELWYGTANVNDKVFVTLNWITPKGWLN